ncbi:MAG: hypothetical protein K9M07_01330 [Simkaniaceae bacterium]|nr:hypothetical protein [Simkaniaceae bacterium]
MAVQQARPVATATTLASYLPKVDLNAAKTTFAVVTSLALSWLSTQYVNSSAAIRELANDYVNDTAWSVIKTVGNLAEMTFMTVVAFKVAHYFNVAKMGVNVNILSNLVAKNAMAAKVAPIALTTLCAVGAVWSAAKAGASAHAYFTAESKPAEAAPEAEKPA